MKLPKLLPIALLLAAAGTVFAQSVNQGKKDESPLYGTSPTTGIGWSISNLTTTPTLALFANGTELMEIRDKDGKLIVRIPREGKTVYGEDYKPDDGAKKFSGLISTSVRWGFSVGW